MFVSLLLADKTGALTFLQEGDEIIFSKYLSGTNITVIRNGDNLRMGYRTPDADAIFFAGVEFTSLIAVTRSALNAAGFETIPSSRQLRTIEIVSIPPHLKS